MASPNNDTKVFKERANSLGLDFVHFRGSFGRFHVAEITCAGGGWLDFDGDGDLDVYLAQGGELHPAAGSSAGGSDRLYRNNLVPEGKAGFTDVTAEAGLSEATGYGCGVSAGDYDNDGWVDVLLYNLGPNQLYRNEAGTFSDVTDVTAPALVEERASTAAAFFDYDRDGWLDLFIGNYVRFEFDPAPECFDQTGAPDYCGPTAFVNEPNQVLRNLGPGADGQVRFADVTAELGIGRPWDPTLGVVTADFDGDGWIDVYVANDGEPNRLWINRLAASGGFTDEALLSGSGVNAGGAAEASMGVAAGDVDADGDTDLFMTHLIRETNTLYLNDGQGFFEDRTMVSGLGAASLSYTSFGTAFFDYDNDGRLDLLVASGAVTKLPSIWSPSPGSEAKPRAPGEFPLDLPNQLFRNLGPQGGAVKFADVTAVAGEAMALAAVSRAAAVGDADNDGDADVLIVNNGGPVHLLLNEVGQRRHWLGLRLVGGEAPRDQLGARAAVLRGGRAPLWRRVAVEGSYNSAHDPRLLFGLGDDDDVDGVRVVWPDGSVEQWDDVAVGRYTTLVQGTGHLGPVAPE